MGLLLLVMGVALLWVIANNSRKTAAVQVERLRAEEQDRRSRDDEENKRALAEHERRDRRAFAIFDEIRGMSRAEFMASRYRNEFCNPDTFSDDPRIGDEFEFTKASPQNRRYAGFMVYFVATYVSADLGLALANFEVVLAKPDGGRREILVQATDQFEATKMGKALASGRYLEQFVEAHPTPDMAYVDRYWVVSGMTRATFLKSPFWSLYVNPRLFKDDAEFDHSKSFGENNPEWYATVHSFGSRREASLGEPDGYLAALRWRQTLGQTPASL